MFADPIVLPLAIPTAASNSAVFTGAGSTTQSFVCTGRGPTSSTYKIMISGTTHWIDLLISRQVGKRSRYTVRLTEYELVADPINDGLNSQRSFTVYLVLDAGVLGVGSNYAGMCQALSRFLYSTSDGPRLLDSILGGAT